MKGGPSARLAVNGISGGDGQWRALRVAIFGAEWIEKGLRKRHVAPGIVQLDVYFKAEPEAASSG